MLPGMPGWGQWPNVPTHPIMLPGMPGWGSGGPRPPVDPGYSPPWAQIPPGGPVGGPPYPDNTLPMPQPPKWPAAPEVTPIPGGPSGNFQWFLSPVYGWVLGVPNDPTTPSVEPPVEPPVEP
jgi:hypothetical protein